LLHFDNVCKSYGSRTVLHERTGRFAPGAYALRGPNGIGKSTLLRVLAGVDDADGSPPPRRRDSRTRRTSAPCTRS
jgi:ABC-type multidrug transport system ATPase subunit